MALVEKLGERRESLARRWADLVLATYPADSVRFFQTVRDPFQNPVGAAVVRDTATIVRHVVDGGADDALQGAIDGLIRIRAVQSFTPAQAVGAVLLLKRAIAEELGDDLAIVSSAEVRALDERIDGLLLRAIDIYTACREQLASIRVREAQSRTYALLKRAGAVDMTEDGHDQQAKGKEPPTSGEGRS